MKKLSVVILKKLFLEAINAGYHHTGDIIQVCEAEISYHNFCQAIAGLKPVIIEDNITYRLRFGVYPDENGENKWLAGYLSEKPYNQYLTIGEGKTLFQAAFHLKRLLKIKD